MESDASSDGISELFDITSHIQTIRRFGSSSNGPFLASSAVRDALELVDEYLSCHYGSASRPAQILESSTPAPLHQHSTVVVRCDVKLNRQTTLSTLYVYGPGSSLEYPVTSSSPSDQIGHLFEIQQSSGWYNPIQDVLYSRGHPSGSSRKGHEVFCDVLVTADGQKVPCLESHWTCEFSPILSYNFVEMTSLGQGSKVCPFGDITSHCRPHTKASREDVARRLQQEMNARTSCSSPKQRLFQKTLAFFIALSNQGCGAPPCEDTVYEGEEAERRMEQLTQLERVQRGHKAKLTCDGRLIFQYDNKGAAFLRCVVSLIIRNILI